MLGDRVRAERAYAAALDAIAPRPQLQLFSRTDYGSILRDAAAVVTLASEGGAPRPGVTNAVQRVEAGRGLSCYTSTQEQARMAVSAPALEKDAPGMSLDVSGETHKGPLYRTFRAADLGSNLKVTNTGDGPAQAVVSVTGAPVTPEPPADRGFKVERLYYTLDGKPAN